MHFFEIAYFTKVVRHWCVLYILTVEMCLVPERRALVRHLNHQKWSEPTHLLYILTSNMCIVPQRREHFLEISTSKSGPTLVCFEPILNFKMCFAPCNGSAIFHLVNLASCLRTGRFSDPTFPSCLLATNHWKNTVCSRLSYLFAHLHVLGLLTLSVLLFSVSNLGLLSASALLCFLICPYVTAAGLVQVHR